MDRVLLAKIIELNKQGIAVWFYSSSYLSSPNILGERLHVRLVHEEWKTERKLPFDEFDLQDDQRIALLLEDMQTEINWHIRNGVHNPV